MQYEDSVLFDMGDEAAQVTFTLLCQNIPQGTTIGFSCGSPGPNPPIYLPPTKVETYPVFTTGIVSDVPANFEAMITYWANFEQQPPANASLTLQAMIIVNQ